MYVHNRDRQGKNMSQPRILCPKCGEKAIKYRIYRIKGHEYIYLTHYSKRDRRFHRWFFGKNTEENRRTLSENNILTSADKIVLSKETLMELHRVITGVNNMSPGLREILLKIASSQRAIVFLYR